MTSALARFYFILIFSCYVSDRGEALRECCLGCSHVSAQSRAAADGSSKLSGAVETRQVKSPCLESELGFITKRETKHFCSVCQCWEKKRLDPELAPDKGVGWCPHLSPVPPVPGPSLLAIVPCPTVYCAGMIDDT